MSSPTTFPLRYVLPVQGITLRATVRMAVVVDDAGGHLEPEVVAALAVAGRSPVASARIVGVADDGSPLTGVRPASAVPGSLRKAFNRTHPRTAALAADLSARSEQFLAGLTMSEGPADVVVFGEALKVVHRELAAADRMRREWMARQNKELCTGEWDLTASDLLPLASPMPTLPADTEIPAGLGEVLAGHYGLLVALCADDDSRRGGHSVVAVYRRTPEDLPDRKGAGEGETWVLDESLSRLRLVDPDDGEDAPATPGAVAGLPTPREALDSVIASLGDSGHGQLSMLDASDEFSRLASTHYRSEELRSLRQEVVR